MAKKSEFQKAYDKILGRQLFMLRDSLKLSQPDMAKKMGVLRQQFDKLEKGNCSTLLFTLQNMFNLANLDLPNFLNTVNVQYLAETNDLRKAAESSDARKFYIREQKRRSMKEEL